MALTNSCKNQGLDIHFNDKNSKEIVDAQCERLSVKLCEKFRLEYEDVSVVSVIGQQVERINGSRQSVDLTSNNEKINCISLGNGVNPDDV